MKFVWTLSFAMTAVLWGCTTTQIVDPVSDLDSKFKTSTKTISSSAIEMNAQSSDFDNPQNLQHYFLFQAANMANKKNASYFQIKDPNMYPTTKKSRLVRSPVDTGVKFSTRSTDCFDGSRLMTTPLRTSTNSKCTISPFSNIRKGTTQLAQQLNLSATVAFGSGQMPAETGYYDTQSTLESLSNMLVDNNYSSFN